MQSEQSAENTEKPQQEKAPIYIKHLSYCNVGTISSLEIDAPFDDEGNPQPINAPQWYDICFSKHIKIQTAPLLAGVLRRNYGI